MVEHFFLSHSHFLKVNQWWFCVMKLKYERKEKCGVNIQQQQQQQYYNNNNNTITNHSIQFNKLKVTRLIVCGKFIQSGLFICIESYVYSES